MDIKEMTPAQLVVAQKWINNTKKIIYKEFSSIDTEKFNGLQKEIDAAEHIVWEAKRIKPFVETHVFDENQSVKWNKEKVIEENKNREEKIQEFSRVAKDLVSKQFDLLYEEVESSYGIPKNAAEKLWSKAYSEGHSEGYHCALSIFEEYLDLFKETLCACLVEKVR